MSLFDREDSEEDLRSMENLFFLVSQGEGCHQSYALGTQEEADEYQAETGYDVTYEEDWSKVRKSGYPTFSFRATELERIQLARLRASE